MGRRVRQLAAQGVVDEELAGSQRRIFDVKLKRILASPSPDVPALRSWIQQLERQYEDAMRGYIGAVERAA